MRILIICLLLFGCSETDTYENELFGNWQLNFVTVATDTSYYEASYDTLDYQFIYSIKEDSITSHSGDENYHTLARYYELIDDSIFIYSYNDDSGSRLALSYVYDIIDEQLVFDEIITWGTVFMYFNSISHDSLNRFIERLGG